MGLVQNKDGTITTEKDYKDAKTWEGGTPSKEKKADLCFSLTTSEKLELRAFEQDNAKNIGEGARREMFRQHAARELLQMREENDSRKIAGKEPINKKDRKISLTNGVVKSAWRAKEENETKRQANISEIGRYNEDCR